MDASEDGGESVLFVNPGSTAVGDPAGYLNWRMKFR